MGLLGLKLQAAVLIAVRDTNFIIRLVDRDVKVDGVGTIKTRFPPEPNGPLHIGHAKSLVLNSTISTNHHGTWTLRLDDTNPKNERYKYVNSINNVLNWFGFSGFPKHFASDYYARLYSLSLKLLETGQAYVDLQSLSEFKLSKGSFHSKGRDSVDRNRAVKDNVKLLRQMKFGRFGLKRKVLRARIDPSSPNLNLRDPVLYRTSFLRHYRTDYSWHVHPTYDYAHAVSDYLEGTTHSLCTLEFEHNKDLYNWILSRAVSLKLTNRTTVPKQIEFARLNIEGMITSKRIMLRLVKTRTIGGFDDLRLGTITSIRRSGSTSEALKTFVGELGISKSCSLIKRKVLSSMIERAQGFSTPEKMVCLNPLMLVLENSGAASLISKSPASCPFQFFSGRRKIILTKELKIEPVGARCIMMQHQLYSGLILQLKGGPVVKCLRFTRSVGGGLLLRALLFSHTSEVKNRNSVYERYWVSAPLSTKITTNCPKTMLASNKNNIANYEQYNNEWLSNGQSFKFEGIGCFIGDYTSEGGYVVKFNITVAL